MASTSLFDMSGQVALVTGGGTGIGLMIAKGLVAHGAKVYIGGRRKDVVDKAVDGSNGQLVALELDVTSKESIKEAVRLIDSQEGKLDTLINNAGQVGPRSPFLNDPSAPELANAASLGDALFAAESFEDWSNLFTINTAAIFFVTSAFLGLLDKGNQKSGISWSSSVVNITSISGVTKLAQRHFAYNASKAAANHITTMFATELALKGVKIRINAIAPGLFPTEMTGKEGEQFDTPEAVNKGSGALVPVPAGRNGSAGEMAGTVLYLTSAAGRYTNGQVLIVDGSYLTVNPSTR